MEYNELKGEVLKLAKERPSFIRKGQFVFNYIDEKYGVAREVQFVDGVDCFHDDSQIESFLVRSLEKINRNQHEEKEK